MKHLNLLLAGLFATVALPFGALILGSQVQLGTLGRAPAEEGGPLFPPLEPGLAVQGRAEYVSLGCIACHTQQVRPAGQGSDIARGYGVRPSVARDYVLQPHILLGERRLGPDLANFGTRSKPAADLVAFLHNPYSSGASFHPSYSFLNPERTTSLVAYLKSLRQDYASPEAPLKK